MFSYGRSVGVQGHGHALLAMAWLEIPTGIDNGHMYPIVGVPTKLNFVYRSTNVLGNCDKGPPPQLVLLHDHGMSLHPTSQR